MNSKQIAVVLRPVLDRRMSDRFVPRTCAACGSDATRVVSRTDYVLYVRCPECCLVIAEPKPGVSCSMSAN